MPSSCRYTAGPNRLTSRTPRQLLPRRGRSRPPPPPLRRCSVQAISPIAKPTFLSPGGHSSPPFATGRSPSRANPGSGTRPRLSRTACPATTPSQCPQQISSHPAPPPPRPPVPPRAPIVTDLLKLNGASRQMSPGQRPTVPDPLIPHGDDHTGTFTSQPPPPVRSHRSHHSPIP